MIQDDGLLSEGYATRLYSGNNSQYSHRVRLAFIHKNIPCKVIECEAADLPKDLLKYNPDKELPMLVDRETHLFLPNIIIEYLEDRYPFPPIMPQMPAEKSSVRSQILLLDRTLSPSIDKLCNPGHTRSPALEDHRQVLRDGIEAIAQGYKRTPYFYSEGLGVTDLVLLPMLWRLPAIGIEIANNPNTRGLREFQSRMFELNWFRDSLTPMELQLVR